MEEVKQLPRPTLEIAEDVLRREVAIMKITDENEFSNAFDELHTYTQQWDWDNYTFANPITGKIGLKDATGKELISAEYDEINDKGNFFFYHKTPKAVKKDGKWGLVSGNGSNIQLSEFKYDGLASYPFTTVFGFFEDGKNTFGILSSEGKELVPNILTSHCEECNGILTLESNGKLGVLDLLTLDVLMPQYDDLEFENPDGLITFVKDGVKGYVNTHNEFVSIEDYDAGNFNVEETFFAMY